MPSNNTSRRDVIRGMTTMAAAALVGNVANVPASENSEQLTTGGAMRYSLNTATVRGAKRGLDELVDIAAATKYDGIEPWVDEIRRYQQAGGSLKDLGKRLTDQGLTVVNAIGFSHWLVQDNQQRLQGLEAMRQDMDLVRQIGGCRIAAPPAGATKETMDLSVVAERYAALLKIGASIGVQPQLELWGFSKTLSRLGELAFVAAESGRSDAALLADVFHIYKGGSKFAGLGYFPGRAMHVFHMNDYPATPPRTELNDAYRVFPGDGVAPISDILRTLKQIGFRGYLSIELFNREYWKQAPALVAKLGLQKMRTAVQRIRIPMSVTPSS